MNKTVSINLGGLFFHIDENAYQKLNHYFDAIRRSLSPDGKDEIMNDIESRIAELLSEKLKSDKQVVSLREVDEVIAVMGKPEDYRIEDETTAKGAYYGADYEPIRSKKFYRDGDKGMIGGVCAGLGHYFRIDPLWIRIIFIISLFASFGTSVLVYLLLWILIPKAITTTEKLEMTGEPINISNIEKKVREEIGSLSDKFQNVDYEKISSNARLGAERVGNGLGSAARAIFKGVAKVIGALITIFSAIGLGTLVVMTIVLAFTPVMGEASWYPYIGGLNYTDIPMWVLAVVSFFLIAIPLFALFLLGLKILVDNMKSIGSLAKFTLAIIWILALIFMIYLGISQASAISSEGKSVSKQEFSISTNDTLQIRFRHNDYFEKSVYYNSDFKIRQDAEGNDVIYSNDITLYVMKTEEALPYIQIEKLAMGRSSSEARKRAEKIKYNFEIKGNTLFLDNYLLTDVENQFRHQNVEVYLYLPEGMLFRPDKTVQLYDNTDNGFFDLWFDNDIYVYRMEKDNVRCLNCVSEEGMHGDMMIPPPPPGPEPAPVPEINATGSGHIDVTDENVKVNVDLENAKINVSTRTN